MIYETFDVVDPPEGLSALNALLRARQGETATLVLRPCGGNSENLFTLVVSEVELEHDTASGIILLEAKIDHGVLSGRLFPAALPGTPVGRITTTTERGLIDDDLAQDR